MSSHLLSRLIAFYLPQYHPIPENDAWWGEGFTEWTNVTKARPMFPGHYQPHQPADLGYYDLRVPETRLAQAELARQHGIEGFCYWHYWFGGKRLLERPFDEILHSGEPDFPFCLAWANQSWSGVWHGAPNRILIEQNYPGEEDSRQHFYALLKAFLDPRYIRIHGKPIFAIYKPSQLPDSHALMDLWNELAVREGLPGIYFIALNSNRNPNQNQNGSPYSGFNSNIIDETISRLPSNILDRVLLRTRGQMFYKYKARYLKLPRVILYENFVRRAFQDTVLAKNVYPTVVPNWDNTPRSGFRGLILHNSTPELFRMHVNKAIKLVGDREYENRLVFIKSWNEWAEGNYLEPDKKFGKEYLQVLADENNEFNNT